MADQKKSRNEFEAELVARAWKDEAFRKELVSNPKAVLEKEIAKLGGKLPADLEIKVLEEDSKHVYLVLPMEPKKTRQTLTEEELGAVAGGATISKDYVWVHTYLAVV